MITQDKIKIFRKYDGDIDSWARSATKKERMIMSNEDWYIIDSLVQDLTLSIKSLSSTNYDLKLNDKIKQLCIDEKTINELKKLI